MKITVTGFLPYGKYRENPAGRIAEYLGKKYNLPYFLLRTSYKEADKFVSELEDDAFVLSFGLYPAGSSFLIEKQAKINRSINAIDEDGFLPSDKIIIQGEKKLLRTSVNINELRDEMKKEEEMTDVSLDPGNYLCNYLYFKTLKKTKGRALFIHVMKESEVYPFSRILNFGENVYHYLFINKISNL